MNHWQGWPGSPRRGGRHRHRPVVSSGVLLRALLFGVGLGLLFGLPGRLTHGPLERPDKIAAASPSIAAGAATPQPRAAPDDDVPASVEVCDEPSDSVLLRTGHRGPADRRQPFEYPPPGARPILIGFDQAAAPELAPPRAGFGRRRAEAGAAAEQVTGRDQPSLAPGAGLLAPDRDGQRSARSAGLVGSTAAPPTPAAADPGQSPLRQLRQELDRQNGVIETFLARLAELERKLAMSSNDLDRVVAGGAGAEPAAAAPGAPDEAGEPQSAGAPAPEPPPGSSQQAQPAAAPDGDARPGEFTVVEEEIDRALERTLVQTGVLLLPFGQIEVEPFFSYTRRETNDPVLFINGGGVSTANQNVNRNEFVAGQVFRIGLPLDSQLEVGLNYRYVDQSVSTPGNGSNQDNAGGGFGDISVGLAKTLLRENDSWWPDVVARISWDSDTGKSSSNGVLLGGGFTELRGGLSIVKRQDPLAFVGGLSYEKSFEHKGVTPGDELGISLGAVLAASPATSLRAVLVQRFVDNPKFDDNDINVSDSVVSTASFGASVVLGPGVLLDIAADIGLTDDAPDYAARASLPIRFNLPGF